MKIPAIIIESGKLFRDVNIILPVGGKTNMPKQIYSELLITWTVTGPRK